MIIAVKMTVIIGSVQLCNRCPGSPALGHDAAVLANASVFVKNVSGVCINVCGQNRISCAKVLIIVVDLISKPEKLACVIDLVIVAVKNCGLIAVTDRAEAVFKAMNTAVGHSAGGTTALGVRCVIAGRRGRKRLVRRIECSYGHFTAKYISTIGRKNFRNDIASKKDSAVSYGI